AKAGSDYQARSAEVIFPARESRATITIPITADSLAESTEQFTVTLSPTGSTGVGNQRTATVNIIDAPAQLLNISTRAQVLTGDNRAIAGFIITGQQSKRVLLLAKGPSLEADGRPVPGRLSDPTLELRNVNRELLQTNDNWKDSPDRQQIEDAGLAPKDDRESAILLTLAPGAYTGIIAGRDNDTGVGLVEVYDFDRGVAGLLANISTRGVVGTGDNVMIGGFIAGNNSSTTRTLIRGIGPSLAGQVAEPLGDPVLELHDANGATLATNDNWKDSPDRAAIEATGIPPKHDLESAILYSISRAAYTAVLRGKDGTGVALVEIYNLR
ncbi:MAG: Calx-beta domain-containing protein, partial [Chthoniobacterales bacterium]